MKPNQSNRIIGLDMHPDVFAAAALEGRHADARVLWVQDRQATAELEDWAMKQLKEGDVIVLEASGNSFEVAARLHSLGHCALVLESAQAGKIRDNFCNDDRHSAAKLARVYASGLAKEVWQPDAKTRERREVLFAHRNAVRDATRARNRIHSFLNEHCVRLKKGTTLTQASGEKAALAARAWTALQSELLAQAFEQLREAQARRKRMERLMVRELAAEPTWARLWRLMGVRHRVAFALMAMIGEIGRFATAKKLVGYFGLAPRKDQSGNDEKGKEKGLGRFGRADVRALLLQSAHNALEQRGSPLHTWGWRLLMKNKHRHEVAVAVARKLTVSVWHLLKGHFDVLGELTEHLRVKLLKLASVLGKDQLRELGHATREAFVTDQLTKIQNTT
jgi:transposase